MTRNERTMRRDDSGAVELRSALLVMVVGLLALGAGILVGLWLGS